MALFGPTAVGKTGVALAVAEQLRERGEDPVAISADALQVYRGLDVLTGAPTNEEQARLEHRLVGFLPVTAAFSVGEYMPLAHREVDRALAAGRRPIVVGGTGLYLRAALTDLSLRPPPEPGVRERLEAEAGARGVAALHAELMRRDPRAARRIEPSDRSRVVRALELLEAGEDPAAASARPERSELWTADVRRPTLLAGLSRDREDLYRRIDARAEAMVAAGAAAEIQAAADAGASATARKALGFDELARGDVEALKRGTRRLAKRQLTWMRKLPNLLPIDLTTTPPQQAAAQILRRSDVAYSARPPMVPRPLTHRPEGPAEPS
ncbi:MAG: tRNA (adenosine(37)-N6)-dimethylallyltransferase MiaA [Thermoleophilaceae bacterium]